MLRHPALIILLLWLAGLGAAGQFAKIAVPFALIRAEYPDAGANTGWLLSGVSLMGVLLGMTGGMLVARLGYRRPLIAALVLGGLLSLRQSAFPQLPEMLALRVLEGLSHLIITIAAPTLITVVAPPHWRGRAMTFWSSFFGVAFALTALFGLPLAVSHGVGALFVAHGVWMIAVAALLIPVLRPLSLPPEPLRDRLSLRFLLRLHRDGYGSATVSAPAWGWLFYTCTFVSALAILPPLLPETGRTAIATALPLLSIATALVAVPLLLRFWPATTITVTGFAAAAVVGASGVMGLSLLMTTLAMFAILGLVQGGSFAAIPQLNDNAQDQSLANGAMAQTGNLGNVIGTPALMAVLGQGGPAGVMAALALLYAGGAAVHLLLARRR